METDKVLMPEQESTITLTEALKKEVLNWPELREMMRTEARQIIADREAERDADREYTRKELAAKHKISTRNLDKKTPEELRRMGYVKFKVGVLTRFKKSI